MTAPVAKPDPIDMMEIFYAPSKVFERRRGGQIFIPWLVLLVVGSAIFFATADLTKPLFEPENARAMARMTPEQREQSKGIIEFVTTFFAILFYILGPIFVMLLIWLAGLVTRVKVGMSAAATIAVFSFYPRIVDFAVTALQAMMMSDQPFKSHYDVSLGVGRFLDFTAPTKLNLFVARIDLFTLWCTALVGIGVYILARCTKAQAATVALIVWTLAGLAQAFSAGG